MRKTVFLSLSLLLSLICGWIDFQTGPEIMDPVFYLIPIALAAWYVNGPAGIAVSILCGAFAAYGTEIQTGLLANSLWIGLWGISSRLFFYFFAVWLLGRQRRTMDTIRQLATIDSLTGVYNARTFFDMLQKEIARSRRYERPLSLIYLDIDNFKTVNDTHGHETGNAVLAAVAAGLQQSVRRMDVVARLGGDEFAILLPETEPTAARTTVERVRENLDRETAQRGCGVTVSIGAVTYRVLDSTADDIIRTADDLMYLVKRSGKNGARFAVIPE